MTDDPDFVLEAKSGPLEANTPPLTRNAVRCMECKTLIESTHRHDFQTCECGAVSVDGGLDYCRVVHKPGATYERIKE